MNIRNGYTRQEPKEDPDGFFIIISVLMNVSGDEHLQSRVYISSPVFHDGRNKNIPVHRDTILPDGEHHKEDG